MSEITATAVKQLREKTGLPMMDCKSALKESAGDEDKAIELLRKRGAAVMAKRSDRETAFGRFGLYCGVDKAAGAIVELKCESAPVAANDEFVRLANDLAQQLSDWTECGDSRRVIGPALSEQSRKNVAQQKDELFNRIREVFNVGRMKRFDGATGGYSHNLGTVSGVLISVIGGNDQAAKDVCMHIAAMRPTALTKEDLDSALVAKEREILRAAALGEGKPENIVDKMVEGRLRNFFAEKVLLEQPFVKDDKQTVGKFAESNGMKIQKFVHWELGETGTI